jgi:polar amino acid transport system substrate-binding protein
MWRWRKRGGWLARLAIGAAVLMVTAPVAAAEAPVAEGASGPRLRVLVHADPPFVLREGDRWAGWAIDLWTEVARQAELDWEIVGETTATEVIDELAAGRVDVGVGDISVTKDRAARVDFSHPFFRSGLRVLVHADNGNSIRGALASLMTPAHGEILLGLLALLAAMSALVYYLSRRHQADHFPEARGEGIVEAVYIAAGALLKGQLDRKLMPGTAGRVLALAWMIFGTAAVAYVTAAVAAALTFQRLNTDYQEIDDFVGKRIAALGGTHTFDWLSQNGVSAIPQPDLETAVRVLLAGEVDAVVHSSAVLEWWIRRHPGQSLIVEGRTLDRTDFALALQAHSPLRLRINLALLTLEESGFFAELDHRWLSSAPAPR